MIFRELEKLILKDGWIYKNCNGSHYQYEHTQKKGKVTIPNYKGDIPKGTVNSTLFPLNY